MFIHFGSTRRLGLVVAACLVLFGTAEMAYAASGGLNITSLENLRLTVDSHARGWGLPLGIILIMAGGIAMFRSIGLGMIGIAGGLIAVLAINIAEESGGTATANVFLSTPAAPLPLGGIFQAAALIYGYVAMQFAQMTEVWVTMLAVLHGYRMRRATYEVNSDKSVSTVA